MRTPHGNVLWDCVSLLDAATVDDDQGRSAGSKAIAISHPHFYTTMVEWSRAFGDVPIHLHAADASGSCAPDPAIQFWDGETLQLLPDVTLIRCGGHFPGGMHAALGARARRPRRALLGRHPDGDAGPQVSQLHAQLSEPDPALGQAGQGDRLAMAPFAYDAIYGHYFDRVIRTGAKQAMQASVDRYIAAVGGVYEDGR